LQKLVTDDELSANWTLATKDPAAVDYGAGDIVPRRRRGGGGGGGAT
jgi:hypothetical protein